MSRPWLESATPGRRVGRNSASVAGKCDARAAGSGAIGVRGWKVPRPASTDEQRARTALSARRGGISGRARNLHHEGSPGRHVHPCSTPAGAVGRPRARPVPAGRRGAPGWSAAGAGRAGDGQDDDPGRVGGGPDRAPGRHPGPGAGADVLAQGGGRPADPDRRPAGSLGGDADGAHLPRLLLRAGATLRRHRPPGAAVAAADRARAGLPDPGDAGGQPGDPAGVVARDPGPGVRHPGVRHRGAGGGGQGPPAGDGSRRHHRRRGRGGSAGVGRGGGVLRGVSRRARRRAGHRLRRAGAPQPDPAGRSGDRGPAPQRDRRGVRRRVPGHRPVPGPAAPGGRRRGAEPGGGGGPRPVGVRVPRRRGARDR